MSAKANSGQTILRMPYPGFIPLAFITAAAAGVFRYAINALAVSPIRCQYIGEKHSELSLACSHGLNDLRRRCLRLQFGFHRVADAETLKCPQDLVASRAFLNIPTSGDVRFTPESGHRQRSRHVRYGTWRPPIESEHHTAVNWRFRRSQSAGRSVSRRALITKPDLERGEDGNYDANDDVDLHGRTPREAEHPGRNQDPDAHD